jgi:hypothetical protein
MAQTVCITLRPVDRERLTAIVSDWNRQRKHIERAQVILASAEGGPVQQIATHLGVSRPMIWRWQQRFAEEGVDGLLRDKTRRPGKAPIAACSPRSTRNSSKHASWPELKNFAIPRCRN